MPIALSGVHVWDGVAPTPSRERCTLRIESGRIAAIGTDPDLVRDAREIPLEGATALPGLIDAHVHLTLDPALRTPADQLAVAPEVVARQAAERARRMLGAGITTVRDLGGGRWTELALRDRIAAGELPGPRVLCAGQPLTSPGGHCHFWGGEARGTTGIDAVVRRQLERGVEWIKVMATGGVFTPGSRTSRPQFDDAEIRRAVEVANAAGRPVAAHCHGTAGIGQAAAAGVRSVEHCSFAGAGGFGSDLAPDVVEVLATRARRGALWVSPTVNAGWGRHLGGDSGPTAFASRMTRVFEQLRASGVPLIASTDAGIPGVEHHRLADALPVMAALAGLSPVECLRSATSESARALGLGDEVGRLRPGFAADVLVCRTDPTRDLAALARPLLVVARGEVGADLRDQGTLA
ncbi:MAG: amidohydrolase family protein [Myxococcota bacterium]